MEDAIPDAPAAAEASSPPTAAAIGSQFPVVGLGASAGGLPALETFFDHTAPEPGMAFVVILHLSPDYESQAAALLQAHTAMPVTQVTGAVPLAPNHVYVIPPAKHLLIAGGHLRLTDAALEQHRRAPIDHFFRTLADTQAGNALAVILSGSGSDGTLGLTRIKEQGGAIFVQDPQEAQFDGMPRSAMATGLVDYVLPVATIPEMLVTYMRRAAQLKLPGGDGSTTVDEGEALPNILALLRVRTGHDFSQYKLPTLLRRIGRRMQVTGVTDMPGYLEVLHSRPEEVQALLQDLLISVTNFFRDREAWAALEAIIPRIFAQRGPGKEPEDQVRVWVPACATGEEAYSVAMLLDEHARTLHHAPAIQIFATDIDDAALSRARLASYPETIVADVSPERLQAYFVLERGHYRVKQELRERVLFAHHNVLRDPPFGRLNLITCRNLLIYLTRDAQDQVLRLFHFSLRPGGYLLLGTAESLDGMPELFDVVAKGQRLYQQRPVPAALPPRIPIRATTNLQPATHEAPLAQATPPGALRERHQELLLAHAPPSVIVNEEYEIVHLSRGIGRFLRVQEGEPSHNLLRVAHPDLRLELRTALFRAVHQGSRVESRRVPVAFDDTRRLVDLIVEPILHPDWPRGYLLVLFSDVGPAGDAASPPAELRGVVQQLEAELLRTKQQLRLTVEDYESAGEEYKAANEELQAINEELRAASEELETSKEELQAVNEELTTVNQELKNKVDEVSQANNDLQNLISATQIAILFLDRQLRITRYSANIQELFNLIPADLHRPLQHVTHTLRDDQFGADAQQVLATLVPVVREVQSTAGRWYLLRVLPYRTADDRIDGVVLTFVEITERKHAEEALRASEAHLRRALENETAVLALAEIGLWRANLGTGSVRADGVTRRIFGLPQQGDISFASFLAAVHPDDRAALEAALDRTRRDGVAFDVEHRIVRPADGAVCRVLSRGGRAAEPAEEAGEIGGASLDITGRKQRWTRSEA